MGCRAFATVVVTRIGTEHMLKLKMSLIWGLVMSAGAVASAAENLIPRGDFRIRDPFVMPKDGLYYLYESRPWSGGRGVNVSTSRDLETWTPKVPAMVLPDDVDPIAIWAPEVHEFDGAFYLLTTLTFKPDPAHPIPPMVEKGFSGGTYQPRGVWVFRSESPRGPFVPVKIGSVTPADWMCLDGTLWIENGKPWMVFCHEWCQVGNGRMMAAPLTDDLSALAAEPVELFRAASVPGCGAITDGPFLRRNDLGKLVMTWSNFFRGADGKGDDYCVLETESTTGSVRGPWTLSRILYPNDGGHGMAFRTFEGQLLFTLHKPNGSPHERMKLFELNETNGVSSMKPVVDRFVLDRKDDSTFVGRLEAGKDGVPEIRFRVPQSADVHWFGAYVRNGTDRWSIYTERLLPGGYFELVEASDKDGWAHVAFRARKADVGRTVRFVARHAANPPPPDAAAIARVAKSAHPRLLIDGRADVFARIAAATSTNDVLAAAVKHMYGYADRLLTLPTAPNPMDGRRMWTQGFTARVHALAQTWKMTGDRRYLDRLEKEIRAVAAYPNWNPEHFLDTALFTYDFAIAYDWLFDDWSDEMRELIATTAIEKGLKQMEPDAFWIHNGNNWSQVNLGCMAFAAIAFAEKVPELAERIVRDAVCYLHEPAEFYGPHGNYTEGPGYWCFGTLYHVLAIDAFQSAFGTEFGLMDIPGFAASADLQDILQGPSGQLFCHSDGGPIRGDCTALWWLARRLNRPDVVAAQRKIALELYAKEPGEIMLPNKGHTCDYCFLPLIWMVDIPTAEASKVPNNWEGRGTAPITVQTANRADPDTIWIAMKGGTANASHAHADQGSFVLDALGERWAEDPGSASYGIGEKKYGMDFWDNARNDSPRWTFFHLGPQGHNLVRIEGEVANVVGFADLALKPGSGGKVAVCDLSEIHPAAKSAIRTGTMSADGTSYTISDDYRGLKPGTELIWQMNTKASPKIDGKTVTLEKNSKRLKLVASDGTWSVVPPALSDGIKASGLVQLQLRVVSSGPDKSWSVTFEK